MIKRGSEIRLGIVDLGMRMIRSAWDGRSWMAGAVALALMAGACATSKKETRTGIAWNTAYNAALADAGQTHRPILLDFYTDW